MKRDPAEARSFREPRKSLSISKGFWKSPMNWDDEIKSLLRTELAAVETYERAVEERAWDLRRSVQAHHLIHILVDHLEAASQLQTQIQQTTRMPVRLVDGSDKRDSGFTLHAAAAKLFGDAKLFSEEATVRALKEGEESRLKAYQDMLQDPATPTHTKTLVDSLVTKQREHIRALDRLAARL